MVRCIIILVVLFSLTGIAQFKEDGLNQPGIKEGIVDQSGSALGFLNSENFIMRHSFSLSYSTFGGNGISLGTYTNSMYYRLLSNLNVQMDVSFMFSPYSSFGDTFQKDISGVYISNAAVNYYPAKDVQISIQYRSLPYSSFYNPYFGSYYGFHANPFYQNTLEEDPFISK